MLLFPRWLWIFWNIDVRGRRFVCFDGFFSRSLKLSFLFILVQFFFSCHLTCWNFDCALRVALHLNVFNSQFGSVFKVEEELCISACDLPY